MGTAREEWDLLPKDPNKTVPAFDAAIVSFKQAFMTSNTKANLIDYINTVVKPRNMAVHTFARRLQSLNRYANELPDEQNIPTLTDDQIKKAVYMAMPDRWQLALIQSGRELKDCTMNFLTEYMENQREFAIINKQRNKRHREADQPVFSGHKYSVAILNALFATVAFLTETTMLTMKTGGLRAMISVIALTMPLALFILKVNTSGVCVF